MQALMAVALFVLLTLAVQIAVVVLVMGERIRLKSLLMSATLSAAIFGICRLLFQ